MNDIDEFLAVMSAIFIAVALLMVVLTYLETTLVEPRRPRILGRRRRHTLWRSTRTWSAALVGLASPTRVRRTRSRRTDGLSTTSGSALYWVGPRTSAHDCSIVAAIRATLSCARWPRARRLRSSAPAWPPTRLWPSSR